MKNSIFTITLLLYSFFAFSQNQPIVQRGSKGLHLVHTVAAKENFYSIGRLYNLPAKEIAAYNSLDMTHGLTTGKTINIPLTATNFSQQKVTAHPVYYVVGEKEGLFRVSANNNNVLMASIRKWNNLTTDKVAPGQKLIVGFLLPGVIAPAVANNNTEKKQDYSTNEISDGHTTMKAEPVVEPKIVEPRESNRNVSFSNESGAGFFKTHYALQTKTQVPKFDETVTAGIFKTASGWQDGKYYVLLDNVEPGTIIKLVNPNNNKAVYAKVLDKMTGVRQNQGYDLRMSNAAATALEVTDTDKFFVRVVY